MFDENGDYVPRYFVASDYVTHQAGWSHRALPTRGDRVRGQCGEVFTLQTTWDVGWPTCVFCARMKP